MSDGKQSPKSAESQNSWALHSSRASETRAELLKKAQEKLAKTDVGSNGKEDFQDGLYRSEAIIFIQKDCINLPDDRLHLLVEKITEILKRRDIEKKGLFQEFTKARSEIMNEMKRTPKFREAENLEEKKGEVFPKDADAIRALIPTLLQKAFANDGFAANFYAEWGPNHPAYAALKNGPNGSSEISKLDQAKSSLGNAYKLSTFDAEIKRDPSIGIQKMKESIQRLKDERSENFKMNKALDQAVGVKFSAPLSPRHVADTLAYFGNHKKAAILAATIKKGEKNPEFVSMIICDWNESNPIVAELRKMGPSGTAALSTIATIRNEWMIKVGVPLSGPITKNLRMKVEDWVQKMMEGDKKLEEWRNYLKNVTEYLTGEWNGFEREDKGNERNIQTRRTRVMNYVAKNLNPAIANCLSHLDAATPGSKEREAFENTLRELRKRKLAIDIMLGANWSKSEVSHTATLIWSLAGWKAYFNNEAEIQARDRAFRQNLNDGKDMAMITYDSKVWGNQAISFESIEKELGSMEMKELNFNTFSGYLSGLYSMGMLTSEHLKSVFWKKLHNAAIHFGFSDDGTVMEKGFWNSKTIKKLQSGDVNAQAAAKTFQRVLWEAMREQLSKERIEQAGGYPRLREYMKKNMSGKSETELNVAFEQLRADIEKAGNDSLSILKALRKSLGREFKSAEQLDAFFKELAEVVVADRRETDRAIGIDVDKMIPKGATMYVLHLTSAELKLKNGSSEAKFIDKLLQKQPNPKYPEDGLSSEEEARVIDILTKASKNPNITPENRTYFGTVAKHLGKKIELGIREIATDQLQAIGESRRIRDKVVPATKEWATKKETETAQRAIKIGWEVITSQRDALRAMERAEDERVHIDEIAKKLGFKSLDDILSSDEKIVAAWQRFKGPGSKLVEGQKGLANFERVLERYFISVTKRKVAYEGETAYLAFMKETTKKADESTEDWRKKNGLEKIPTKSGNDSSETMSRQSAEERRESRSFFNDGSNRTSSESFLNIIQVGEKVSISSGYVVERTTTWVAFVTPDGKWKVDGKAAEGALSIAKTLHESGADFLISSIGRIAMAEGIWYKDGMVSKGDERRLLIFMADFFGIREFDKDEPDVTIMQEKFTLAVSRDRRSLKQKGKDIGIVSDSGSLIHSKLDERLATFNAYRSKGSTKPERASVPA